MGTILTATFKENNNTTSLDMYIIVWGICIKYHEEIDEITISNFTE